MLLSPMVALIVVPLLSSQPAALPAMLGMIMGGR